MKYSSLREYKVTKYKVEHPKLATTFEIKKINNVEFPDGKRHTVYWGQDLDTGIQTARFTEEECYLTLLDTCVKEKLKK